MLPETGNDGQGHKCLQGTFQRKAIKKNMAARRKNERDKKANKKDINKKPQKDDALALNRLTGDFRHNRGRLPQPVKNGVVTRRFGKQQHPTLPIPYSRRDPMVFHRKYVFLP